MRALILVGGKATRLRPLTQSTPKAMAPVLGRPLLEHVLAWLRHHDVSDVTLLLGYLPDAIRAYLGDGAAFGVRLRYVVEREPLGSGGAMKQLEAELTEPFLALNGDIYTDLDVRAMTVAHRAAQAAVTISLVAVADPSLYGVVATDESGWIRSFVEKPTREAAPSNLINAGTWLFEPETLRRIPTGEFSMVEQHVFPDLAREGKLLGYPAACYWMDVGTPARYLQLHRDLLTGRVTAPLSIVRRPGWPGLVLAERADTPTSSEAPPVVERSATIEEHVVIGPATRIGAGAQVRGPASLGVQVRLEADAVVQDSVLWDACQLERGARVSSSILAAGCVVGQHAVVQDSVLGEGVRVRPGAIVHGVSVEPGETIS